MEPERELDFFTLLREFTRRNIRCLIIGRRAVILYGAPVLTSDYDLWVHPEDKRSALALLAEELDVELSDVPNTRKPLVSGYSGMRKYDFFFQRSVKTIENEKVDFEECYKHSTVKEDRSEDIRFRVPSIDDLIRLKKVRKPNVKDEQDIEYLLKAKQLSKLKKSSP